MALTPSRRSLPNTRPRYNGPSNVPFPLKRFNGQSHPDPSLATGTPSESWTGTARRLGHGLGIRITSRCPCLPSNRRLSKQAAPLTALSGGGGGALAAAAAAPLWLEETAPYRAAEESARFRCRGKFGPGRPSIPAAGRTALPPADSAGRRTRPSRGAGSGRAPPGARLERRSTCDPSRTDSAMEGLPDRALPSRAGLGPRASRGALAEGRSRAAAAKASLVRVARPGPQFDAAKPSSRGPITEPGPGSEPIRSHRSRAPRPDRPGRATRMSDPDTDERPGSETRPSDSDERRATRTRSLARSPREPPPLRPGRAGPIRI